MVKMHLNKETGQIVIECTLCLAALSIFYLSEEPNSEDIMSDFIDSSNRHTHKGF